MPAVDLAIIIVHWNTRRLLQGCLDSVRREAAAAPFTVETWVVDNASEDGTAALLKECYPWVRAILNDTNPGFAAANNQALREVRGEMALLLNADTVLHPGALNELVAFMRAHPEVGAAGARILNPDGSLQVSCYPAPTLFREFWRLFHLDSAIPLGTYAMDSWDLDTPRPVDAVLGACMLVPMDVVDRVGLLDEAYFMYSEEIDWCLRIRRAGRAVFWVPAASVVHFGGQSTRQVQEAMFLQLYRSKLRYFRKHHGRLQGVFYKLLLAAAAVFRLALSPLTVLQHPRSRRENLTLAGRYARLLRRLPDF